MKPDQISAFEDIEFEDIPVPNSAASGAASNGPIETFGRAQVEAFRGVDITLVAGSPPFYRCRCGERVLVTHSLESLRDAITLDLDRSETDQRRSDERKRQLRRAISLERSLKPPGSPQSASESAG